MKSDRLRTLTRKELASIARRRRLAGWHAMRKEELVQALALADLAPDVAATRAPARKGRQTAVAIAAQRASSLAVRLKKRDLTTRTSDGGASRGVDRLNVAVRDPYWLHATWSLSRSVVQRAQSSLGTEWHAARPVLRLYSISGSDVGVHVKTWLRDVEIHGEIDNWFVPVDNPPNVYRLEIGYLAPSGKFYALAASRVVRTPRPGSLPVQEVPGVSQRGHADGDLASGPGGNGFPVRQLRWELGNTPPAAGAAGSSMGQEDFLFRVDTELLIHGLTHPDADVTLSGDKVKINKDGSFSLRISLPEGRNVIPAVTVAPCGSEQRTIVLSVERNTKELEPQPLDEQSTW